MNIKDLLIGAAAGVIIGLVSGMLWPVTPAPEPKEPVKLKLPEGFVRVGPCFPGKGVHYLNPSLTNNFDPKVPAEEAWLGPTYLLNEITGEVLAVEYHFRTDFPEAQFALSGITKEVIERAYETGVVETDWRQVQKFDFFGAEYQFLTITQIPGHEGYAVPHFDVHFFTKSPEELDLVCQGQL